MFEELGKKKLIEKCSDRNNATQNKKTPTKKIKKEKEKKDELMKRKSGKNQILNLTDGEEGKKVVEVNKSRRKEDEKKEEEFEKAQLLTQYITIPYFTLLFNIYRKHGGTAALFTRDVMYKVS